MEDTSTFGMLIGSVEHCPRFICMRRGFDLGVRGSDSSSDELRCLASQPDRFIWNHDAIGQQCCHTRILNRDRLLGTCPGVTRHATPPSYSYGRR